MIIEPRRANGTHLDLEPWRVDGPGATLTELDAPAGIAAPVVPVVPVVPEVVCPACRAPLDLASLVDRVVALRTRASRDVRDIVVTNRERAVLDALLQGYRTHQIATLLGISPHTVRKHLRSLYAKTDCASQAELVAFARSHLRQI